VIEIRRKFPVQKRAEQTVETLLDAAAQVLQEDGEAHFNTNRVAEAAGFSIGTLYQYFPNKGAIVAGLAARERVRIEAMVVKAVATANPRELEDAVRIVVRTLVTAFGGRRKVRKFVIVEMVRANLGPVAMKAFDDIGILFVHVLGERGAGEMRPLSKTGAFILTRAVMGAIRMAVLEDSDLLETPEFEDELVRLALRFLAP
jgi:AcrR family transcriptional regulator